MIRIFRVVLLVLIIGTIGGCSNDDQDIILSKNIEYDSEAVLIKKHSSFNELKTLLKDSPILDKLMNSPMRGNGASFVVGVDSTSVIQQSNSELETYTLKLYTSEDSDDNFTNLIISVKDSIVDNYIFRYVPSQQYINDKQQNTSYVAFDGLMQQMDWEGAVLSETNVDSGYSGQKLAQICSFSVDVIWQCDAGNPHSPGDYGGSCSVGGSEIIGMTINISCSSGSPGGSGSSGGGSGGGGGGGSGNGDDCVGCLPTDPLPGDECTTVVCALENLLDPLMLTGSQVYWLGGNQAHQQFAVEMLNYIFGQGSSEESKLFALEALEAKMYGGSVDFEEQIIIDQTFNSNSRLKSIYNKFKVGDNTIGQYIQNFIPNGSVANLRLSTDDNFQSNQPSQYWVAGAITMEPQDYLIDIIFNTDSNLPSSSHNFPKIILAVEFMHEVVHAEMYRKLLSHAQQPQIPWTQAFINSLRNDFEGLSDYYTRWWLNLPPNQPPTSAQHQQMAQHYINIMAQALSDYDNGQHTQDFYEALSWFGLMETAARDLLTAGEQQNIQNIIQNAINNEPFN